ncbi:hypothetical protein SteCoe_32571 [Stentor coeruleus]|uniref:Uncharacterized protein n=1 Tax=Stentor coeruleus TaxID=5963 RepID=A0A1R2AYX2_9CILI|nr:hypothetical protein SteCoe_32571 [Stentor coeruleus]
MLRTFEYVYFYNYHFEELFKVQSLKKDVEISDNEGTELCFYCFCKEKLMVWTYDLTAEDRKKLGFNPKKLWQKQNVSLFKRLIINIVCHDDFPINAYSPQANRKFLPIIIDKTHPANEETKELDEHFDEEKEDKLLNKVCANCESVEKPSEVKDINGYEEVFEESK